MIAGRPLIVSLVDDEGCEVKLVQRSVPSHAEEGLDGARSPYLVDDQEGTRAPICRSRCREFKGRDDYGRREGAPRRQRL